MKVILLQDVAKLGRRFSIVEVPSGHALNKLIPQGLAEEATKQNLTKLQKRIEKGVADRVQDKENVNEALQKLKEAHVVVSVTANDHGHLFETLKPKKIADAMHAVGVVIDEEHIHIEDPIKEIGEHSVKIGEGDVANTVTIKVEAA